MVPVKMKMQNLASILNLLLMRLSDYKNPSLKFFVTLYTLLTAQVVLNSLSMKSGWWMKMPRHLKEKFTL